VGRCGRCVPAVVAFADFAAALVGRHFRAAVAAVFVGLCLKVVKLLD